MTFISFHIDGKPAPKERPRILRSGITYTPKKTLNAEKYIGYLASIAMGGKPLMEGPLIVWYTAIFPVPKSWSKQKKQEALSGKLMPICRPDIDNCVKLALDAMNGIVYKDDSQIVILHMKKKYGETPKSMLTIFSGEKNE